MEEKKVQGREVDTPAIEVKDVVKIYKLYDKPKDRLKEAFGFGKKKVHKLHYALNGVRRLGLSVPTGRESRRF